VKRTGKKDIREKTKLPYIHLFPVVITKDSLPTHFGHHLKVTTLLDNIP
jgi:hypothetical protein